MSHVGEARTHKDLEVWKQAMDLVDAIYRITQRFPRDELYGLVTQMRRAAVSIPSNVAEGAARSGKKEFKQFLRVSLGSLAELETQVLISRKLNYMDREEALLERIETVRRLLLGLVRHLKKEAP